MICRSVLVIFALCCVLTGDARADFHKREIQESLEARTREEVIFEGGFEGIEIGSSKDRVLADLKSMGITHVYPDLRDRIVVTRAEDLDRLRSEDGIIVGAGSVVAEFQGDEVERLLVAPILLKWTSLLSGAKTRSQVFDGLREILERFDGVAVRNIAPDARYVRLEDPGPEETELLSRFNLWQVSDRDGNWHLRLEFEAGLLNRISVRYSPDEP